MKNNIKKLPGSQVELEVTLTDAEFQPYWQPAYDAAASNVEVKGFRPGAAPKELLAQGVDQEKVFQAALQSAIRATLDEIKQEKDWTFIDAPRVELIEGEVGIKYKAILTLFPKVTLGNYKKIAGKVLAQKKEVSVGQKEIDETVQWLLKSRAGITLVNRAAALGDLVEADITTHIDGKEVANAQFKGDKFVIGESHFIVGFDEKIVSHKAGDIVSFSLVAPENYWDKSVRGKSLEFKVTIKGVYERKIPELNDDFAKGLGRSFNSVADLTKNITEGLTQEKAEKEIERLRALMLDEIVKDSKLELPAIMVEKTLDSMMKEMTQMMPPQDGGAKEELHKELSAKMLPRAENNVAGHLVLYKIAQVEKLVPTAVEIEAEAKGAQVDLEQYYDYIYGRLQNQKVFKFLEEKAG